MLRLMWPACMVKIVKICHQVAIWTRKIEPCVEMKTRWSEKKFSPRLSSKLLPNRGPHKVDGCNIHWWPRWLDHLTALQIYTCFASVTLISDSSWNTVCENTKYVMKWVLLFLSSLEGLVRPPFAAVTAARLSGTVSVHFLRTSKRMFCQGSECKPKPLTLTVRHICRFYFPNLLNGVEVWTLRGSVHHFQRSSRFQQTLSVRKVPATVKRMFILMGKSTKTAETP